jgi:hypothetical protein
MIALFCSSGVFDPSRPVTGCLSVYFAEQSNFVSLEKA